MIYTDAHVRYRQSESQSWTLSLWPEKIWSVVEITSERPTADLQLSTPGLRSRSIKWSIEDNTAWYGQEKKKLWVNIAVSLCLPVSVSLPPQKIWPFLREIKRYIYITKCCGFFLHHGYTTLALKVLFFLLISFTVGHTIWDCLSSTEFLILLIWPWMYSICSLCAYLSFCTLVLVGFLLLHRDAVFTLSHFFLTANVSHGTLCLALGLVGIHSAAASMWEMMKFSYLSFGVGASDISWRL